MLYRNLWKEAKEIAVGPSYRIEPIQLVDESYAELDRITTKIELMADANATARAEMKLGALTP